MVERQTAVKVAISWLLDGEYVQKEGWEPNYVRTCAGNVSRANIMGVITQVDAGSFLLDDGSGTIPLRTFDGKVDVNVGDPVLVIGRPRVYGDALFITYEILKKINSDWLAFRKWELAQVTQCAVEKHAVGEEVIVKSSGENLFSKIIEVIRLLDKENNNQGADTNAVIKQANTSEAEHIVRSLLEEGEIFEMRPGMIKVLE